MKRILSISNDIPLLMSRHLLLRQMRCEVLSVHSFAAALEACEATPPFDLVIVGHTIPAEERDRIIAHVKETCACPVLALLRANQSPVEGATGSVDAQPEFFLSAVSELLGTR